MQSTRPPNPFLERINAQKKALGTFIFSTDPALTEIVAGAGFHLAIIDTEHAVLGYADLAAHGRAAAAAGTSWWVRVGRFDGSEIGKILDCGAQGVIFPHYGLDPALSGQMTASLRYPPRGTRPTCTGARAAAYGLGDFSACVEAADREVLSVGLVEDASVVECVEDILAESDLDVVMPGGIGDLASSLGLHGQARHPKVVEAVRRIIVAAKGTGRIKVGVYLSDIDSAADFEDLSPDFYVYSIDYKVISAAFRSVCNGLQRLVSHD
jgi:2-keto-3-deoxy-L-rhamnonate aldolase RhmA